ncbi:NADH dehydrogenase [ubiquinone] 1 alpha subcomplex assembly factor 3 [Galdieria sulphuraria]|nr:NADH dehydrogenase [ubiquinone] 1 alpha subcomplex assembly factor 3 [Galdieria sulphuraria]
MIPYRTSDRLWQCLSHRKLSSFKSLIGETNGNRMKLDGYSGAYFVVNNVEVRSSILLLPHTGYLWRPQTFAEVTPNSFTLFRLLVPKLDILIVGGGSVTPHLSEENYRQVSSVCQAFELLKTEDACSLFNLMNEEEIFGYGLEHFVRPHFFIQICPSSIRK